MTTIVYSHKEKVIACDSRETKGGMIATDNCQKIFKREDGIVFVGAGTVHDINIMIATYPQGYEGMDTLTASAFVIDGGRVYDCAIVDGSYHRVEIGFNLALGSGQDFAIAALDFGYTAKQAVKYAMTRDCATGGKIRTVKVR